MRAAAAAAPLLKICVPTTAGTGSETTRTSIVTDAAGNKVWLWGDELKADEVLLDPALTVGLPPALTAATGIDALVHAIEATTNRNAFAAQRPVRPRGDPARGALAAARGRAPPTSTRARRCNARPASPGSRSTTPARPSPTTSATRWASLRPIHHGRAVGLAMLATLAWNVGGPVGRWAAVAAAMGEPAEAGACPRLRAAAAAVGIEVGLAGEGFGDVTPERSPPDGPPPRTPRCAAPTRARGEEDLWVGGF